MSGVLLREAVRLASGGRRAGDPPAAGGADLEEVDPAAFLKILADNKVPLVPLAHECEETGDPRWRALLARPGTEAALEREEDLKRRLLDAYKNAASALRAAGIETVLFKTPFWFPYLSSNLDVLVKPAVFAEAARVLESAGHIRFPHYREDHKLLFRTFHGGEPALSIHLHEAVS